MRMNAWLGAKYEDKLGTNRDATDVHINTYGRYWLSSPVGSYKGENQASDLFFRHDAPSFTTHLKTRACHLALVPCRLVLGVIDAVGGSLVATASCLFFSERCIGGRRGAYVAGLFFTGSTLMLSDTAAYTIQALNPRASFSNDAKISSDGVGLTRNFVQLCEKKLFTACYSKQASKFTKKVIPRLTAPLLFVAKCISRIVDLALGLLAYSASLLTFGKIDSINNIAYRGLQIPGLISDTFDCIYTMIRG